ncbi:kinase-like domain-containing protein [Schizophyllum amplum]|uniref:Kinase-like domain-containing protein n=1 Tax=Schizophyllum amplum TaxID=97359 RepID=A0A550CGV6_9AGAR|nr:kinase-like domain-containing protein [Auriculariopsis ampla]
MALRYNARPESSDTLTIDDFELVESLSPDGSYTRKLVRCCRGRLKSRLFVMRKIIDLQDDESCQEEQSIHSDLCHPSIVAFVASLPSYVHILEHCEAGTLTAYLSVLKRIGLSRKALVVHRDIQPDNILLTSSNRPKLCNFSSAVRLSSRSDRASGSYGAFENRAPEIVSDSPYNLLQTRGPLDVSSFYVLQAFIHSSALSPPALGSVVSDTLSKHRTLVSSTAFDKPSLAKATVRPVAAAVPTTEAIPIGTVRPSPSTTHLMAPKSHKALHGHVTVLPSRSLLVDFREAERRRNLKGNTVLLVSPDGLDVKVYSAPHLSTPCCLTEPIAEYSLDALPSAYWKVYNDAAALVEKIKQRTPRLVMYEEGVKCSLMADRTPGDIELDFFSSDSASAQTSGGAGKPEATMRIRLSRKTRTVELIRDASTGSGAEWTRKTYTYLGDSFDSSDASRDMGSRAFDALSHFVRVCERMEALAGSDSLLDVDSGSMLGARSAPIKPSTTALRSPDLATCPVEEGGP